jgi:D-alanyl-D-alanine carboxypeptidase
MQCGDMLRFVGRRCGRLTIALAVLWVAACGADQGESSTSRLVAESSAAPTAPPETPPPPTTSVPAAAATLELDALVGDFVGSRDGGVGALLIRAGATTTAAAGVANVGGDPVTAATRFRVGSISKTFVAAMVLQLVDEHRIELDRPLSTYLPDTPLGGDVTIRALLSHRSGLPNYTDDPTHVSELRADPSRYYTPDDILNVAARAPAGEPDQHFAYSNTNYILLGQLIEHLDATDLNTALHNRITGPLELDATSFATASDPSPSGVTAGWSAGVLDGDPAAAYHAIASSAWAAGSLVSTVGDLADFLAALFAGEVISERSLDEMTTIGPEGYGLGLASIDLGPDSTAYGHGGRIFGGSAAMAIEPASGDVLVIVTNNDGLIAERLAAQILENW